MNMKRVPPLCLLLLAATISSVAQAPPPPPTAPPQTPRQALLEMFFSKDPRAFDRHLPKLARKKLESFGMLERADRPVPFNAREMAYLTTFDSGPILLTFEPPPARGRHSMSGGEASKMK